MGRSESKQVVNQGTSQSAQNQLQGQQSFDAGQSAINDLQNQVKAYQANNPYLIGGEWQTSQRTLNADSSNAGTNSLGAAMRLHALQTGQNEGSYAPSLAEEARQASRDQAAAEAKAEQSRIQNEADYNLKGVQAGTLAPDLQARLYGVATGGAGSNLSSAANAAKTPGFWDTFSSALAQGAGTAAAGFCPCEGSMIRMADGTDKPVEQLRAGDYLWPLSTSALPNPVLEDPQPTTARCFEMLTSRGLSHRGSQTHTIALAVGGYAFLPEVEGMTVLAGLATDVVAKVADIGERTVYPLKIGGSHIYQADEIWVLA